MEYRDYYATLGVSKGASQADIKKAFRKLARENHPDVNTGDEKAERRFKEISEANEVLSDPEKRKAYDELGANWASYQTAGAGAGAGNPFAGFGSGGAPGGIRFEYRGDPEDLSGFSDFFRTFFAGGASSAGAAGPSAGSWSRARGGSTDPLFGGLGGDTGAGYASSGFGTASARGTRRAPAPRPDATASATISLDEVLRGTERVLEVGTKRLEVRIPPGVKDGQRIRLSGKAEGGGNVYLTVRVRPHPVFERSGANLTRELQLGLGEALLGAEVDVGTLDGRTLRLTIPPGTQSGRLFRLAGQGLPLFGGGGRGDLLVRTRLVLPERLDEEGQRLARELVDHLERTDPRRAGSGTPA